MSGMTTFYNNRRSRTTQTEILSAYADRLRIIGGWNDQNVVVTDQPVPDAMPGGGFCITVSAGSGQGSNPGGHHATATENCDLIVGIYKRTLRDRVGRGEAKLLHPGSMYDLKHQALKSLMVEDSTVESASPCWEPVRFNPELNGHIPLLREVPEYKHSTPSLDVPDHKGWIGIQITFAISFDWDLYA
jgi:hypothetical protein